MKSKALAVVVLLAMFSPASAIMIDGGAFDGTDVGTVDTMKGQIAKMSSGDQTEVDWVNSILGTSFTKSDYVKQNNVVGYNTDQLATIAFQLAGGPGFYLIKNANVHVLLENNNNFDWGVVDLNPILGKINLHDDIVISHVGGFGSTSVPAPATLALLGLGLVGLGFARRRIA